MPYIIRNTTDNPIWQAFQQRAAKEGRSLKWVIWTLIIYYVEKGLPD
jgi:hypothetical protein